MSANNWTVCPRCRKKEAARVADCKAAAQEAYGKVSADEYHRLLEAAQAPPRDLDSTFREDWHVGMQSEGTFRVGYSGHCTTCDYGHKYEYTESVEP